MTAQAAWYGWHGLNVHEETGEGTWIHIRK